MGSSRFVYKRDIYAKINQYRSAISSDEIVIERFFELLSRGRAIQYSTEFNVMGSIVTFKEEMGSSSHHNIQQLSSAHYLHKNVSHSRIDFKCLGKLFHDRTLCDVTLVAGEIEVHAHKVILAACSTFFHGKFTQDRKLGCFNRIVIEDIPHETLSAVVSYIYNSEVMITFINVEGLLAAASKLILVDLQEACWHFLKANLNSKNFATTAKIARRYSCAELIRLVDDYMNEHFSEIAANGEYLSLTYEQMSALISRDAVRAAEEQILECVIGWIRHDLQHRKEYMYSLLKTVRFPLIQQGKALLRLEKEQWLKTDTAYSLFLAEMFKCYALEGHTSFSTTPRQSIKLKQSIKLTQESKYLVTVSLYGNFNLKIQMFDFGKNQWFDVSTIDRLSRPKSNQVAIAGYKIYYENDGTMISREISRRDNAECNDLFKGRSFSRMIGFDNSIYTYNKPNTRVVALGRIDVVSKAYKFEEHKLEYDKVEYNNPGLGVLNG